MRLQEVAFALRPAGGEGRNIGRIPILLMVFPDIQEQSFLDLRWESSQLYGQIPRKITSHGRGRFGTMMVGKAEWRCGM